LNSNPGKDKRWRKAELHTHCNLDPTDYRSCEHSPKQLISRAAELGYEILALTCHDKDIWTRSLSDYARHLGITLIPGMEVAAEGSRHVLVYNFHTGSKNLNTLGKIRNCSREDTLVIAPHAFYPGFISLQGRLAENAEIFDAIEYSGFYIRGMNFNRRSADFSRKTGKPLVGFGDIHYLWQLNRTYTWIYSEPEIESIIGAVKQGQVRIQTSPLSLREAVTWWTTNFWRHAFPVNAVPPKHAPEKLLPARH
jgi:predicted metal-dependent phosphoesterase TrpH